MSFRSLARYHVLSVRPAGYTQAKFTMAQCPQCDRPAVASSTHPHQSWPLASSCPPSPSPSPPPLLPAPFGTDKRLQSYCTSFSSVQRSASRPAGWRDHQLRGQGEAGRPAEASFEHIAHGRRMNYTYCARSLLDNACVESITSQNLPYVRICSVETKVEACAQDHHTTGSIRRSHKGSSL